MPLKSHAQLLCYFPSVLSNFATVVSWSRNLVKLHSKLVSLHLIFGKERLVVLKVVPIIIKKFVLPKQLQICDMYQLIISDLICARKLLNYLWKLPWTAVCICAFRDFPETSFSKKSNQLWVACYGTSSILWCSFFQCNHFEIIEIIEVAKNVDLEWVEFN